MDAPVLYFVRFWVKPGSEQAVLAWLDGGHMADVVALPGFLWSRRTELEETDADGWSAHIMVYGLESLEALHTYSASDAAKAFAKEREDLGLAPVLRMSRFWGEVKGAVNREPA